MKQELYNNLLDLDNNELLERYGRRCQALGAQDVLANINLELREEVLFLEEMLKRKLSD